MSAMVSADRVVAFAAMSFVLIVVPGPSVLFVIGRALAQGRRAVLTTVVGNTLGAYVVVVAVAVGIGAVVERSAVAFTLLKLAGAAYLVYLGIKAVRARGSLSAGLAGDGHSRGGPGVGAGADLQCHRGGV
jgi:threonine/homoserine/homoserine lactone efflux protein